MVTKRKVFIFASIAAVFSQIFVAIAALPMNMVFWLTSAKTYALSFSFITLLLFALGSHAAALAFGFTALNLLIFNILRSKKITIFMSGLTSALASLAGLMLVSFLMKATGGQSLFALIKEKLAVVVQEASKLGPGLEGLDTEVLFSQLPSAIIVYFMVCNFLVLATEVRLISPFARIKRKVALSAFKVPESCIWVFIASLLAAFVETEHALINQVGVNFFNVLMVIYFFQGLAIIKGFYEAFNVGTLWRILGYFIFIFQLSILTAGIGVVDYWVNFRARFIRRASQLRQELKK